MRFQPFSVDESLLFEVDNEALKRLQKHSNGPSDSFFDWFFICPRYFISFLSESLND